MKTIYAHLGTTEYTREPVRAVPIFQRDRWEFNACLNGAFRLDLPRENHDEVLRSRTLWCLPARHAHGWLSDAPCERALFHFSSVPPLLESSVPARGYYRVPITDADCERLRVMAMTAIEANRNPGQRIRILSDALMAELSLMALREVPRLHLSEHDKARARTEQALYYFNEHMSHRPTLADIAAAAHVSAPYLRQLFYKARQESPQTACNRERMRRVRELLMGTTRTLDCIAEQVGFSSASALSRAVKDFFGATPRQIRQ